MIAKVPPILAAFLEPMKARNGKVARGRRAHGAGAADLFDDGRPADQNLPSREERRLRGEAYLETIPPSVSGDRGSDECFAAALALVKGFSLDAEDAFDLLSRKFNPTCRPPWSDADLRHKMSEASHARKPWAYLMPGLGLEPVDDDVGQAVSATVQADGAAGGGGPAGGAGSSSAPTPQTEGPEAATDEEQKMEQAPPLANLLQASDGPTYESMVITSVALGNDLLEINFEFEDGAPGVRKLVLDWPMTDRAHARWEPLRAALGLPVSAQLVPALLLDRRVRLELFPADGPRGHSRPAIGRIFAPIAKSRMHLRWRRESLERVTRCFGERSLWCRDLDAKLGRDDFAGADRLLRSLLPLCRPTPVSSSAAAPRRPEGS